MHQPKKKPEPARVSGFRSQRSTSGYFTSLASIRRSFGTGWPGYESAKAAWHAANPGAESRQVEAAMRRIARAVRV